MIRQANGFGCGCSGRRPTGMGGLADIFAETVGRRAGNEAVNLVASAFRDSPDPAPPQVVMQPAPCPPQNPSIFDAFGAQHRQWVQIGALGMGALLFVKLIRQ